MKIFNVVVLEEESITYAYAQAFLTKKEAEAYAENLVTIWLNDNEGSEVNRSYKDHIAVFNDDYLFSIDIEEQEL